MSDPIKDALDLLTAHPELAPLVGGPDPRDLFCHRCGASTPNGLGCCRACSRDYEYEARDERGREGLVYHGPKWDPYD